MDPKTILNTLKEASPFDLFLISFLLLPFVFDAWVGVLTKLEFSESSKYSVLAIVLVGYVIGVISMLVGANRSKERAVAKNQIIQYLTSKEFEMMSFERIRKNINLSYSDHFLDKLPVYFPNDLRKAKLKGAKPGLARILESETEDQA
ncbi:MAG: hypothetical protein ACPGJI_07135 [Kangiellaceae bacterium]